MNGQRICQNINRASAEFVAHLKQKDRSEVIPTTLRNYILRIHRGHKQGYRIDIHFVDGNIFNNANTRICLVTDNKVHQLQGDVNSLRGHSVLGEEHICKIFPIKALSNECPKRISVPIMF